MTNQDINQTQKPHYLQKYMGKERRNDRIQNTALLELVLDLSPIHALGDSAQDNIEQLMVLTKQRLHQRLRDTDVVLPMSQKFIILLEEVDVISHAKTVSDELLQRLKVPFKLAENHLVKIEMSISINLFSKFDLKFAAFPRNRRMD